MAGAAPKFTASIVVLILGVLLAGCGSTSRTSASSGTGAEAGCFSTDDPCYKKVAAEAAQSEAQIFANYSRAEKAAYRRGYRDCDTMIADKDIGSAMGYVSSHNE